MPQREHARLVDEGEEAEVASVLPRCFENKGKFLSEGAGAEEKDHAVVRRGSNCQRVPRGRLVQWVSRAEVWVEKEAYTRACGKRTLHP